jgi:hypothetical protein
MSDEQVRQLAARDLDPDGPPQPDPAREALEEPPITAEELEKEIGNSDAWDEASEGPGKTF